MPYLIRSILEIGFGAVATYGLFVTFLAGG